jgi:hypothetical protein
MSIPWLTAGLGVQWLQNLDYDSATLPDAEMLAYKQNADATYGASIIVAIAGMKVFQKSYNNLQSRESSSAGWNTGCYLLASSSGNQANALHRLMATVIGNAGIGGGGSGIYEAIPQWKELIKSDGSPLTQGEVEPSNSLVWSQRPIHQTGFIDDMGGPRGAISPGVPHWDTRCAFTFPTATGVTYYLWHYSPWAWFGTVPNVVAAIAIKCGMDASSIDQPAFDYVHDAYDLLTGDVPFRTATGLIGNYVYYGATSKYEIACNRTVGDRCIDLIKKCILHSNDIYFVNEAGKLSVQSHTRPNNRISLSLSLSDGIIGDVEWKYDNSLMFNVAYTSWGSGVLVTGMVAPGEEQFVESFSAVDEPTMNSYAGPSMSAVSADQASMDKYGIVQMRGVETDVNIKGTLSRSQRVHFPFHLSCHSAAGDGRMEHIAAWMKSNGKIPRTVTITQDFRALDWGIGTKVLNVAVTDDGQVIPGMWCIERTYDFDRLTVTSVLMEQPLNT